MKRISELIEGASIFESSGFSTIKITKDGVSELVELPIKSTGVAEYQEKLRSDAPKPPVRKELIKKNSKEGKELGIPHDRMLQVFDTTDEAYIDKLGKHEQDFIWQVIVFALDIIWKKKDGSTVNTFDEKRAILKSTGITSAHSEQIFKDVQGLTQIAEGEEDFLSDK